MFIFTTDYKIERDTVLEIKADKIEGKILENNLQKNYPMLYKCMGIDTPYDRYSRGTLRYNQGS